MPSATLGQIDERLLVVDDLLFKISTGQLSVTTDEQERLTAEADWIMDALAKGISAGGQYDYQTAWNERDKVRKANRFAAVVARYSELHPEPDPDKDRVVARAFADDASEEDMQVLIQMYSEIFIEQPAPPTPPQVPKSFFSRLFSRR